MEWVPDEGRCGFLRLVLWPVSSLSAYPQAGETWRRNPLQELLGMRRRGAEESGCSRPRLFRIRAGGGPRFQFRREFPATRLGSFVGGVCRDEPASRGSARRGTVCCQLMCRIPGSCPVARSGSRWSQARLFGPEPTVAPSERSRVELRIGCLRKQS